MSGTAVMLTLPEVASAAALLVFPLAASSYLRLGLTARLGVSALRAALQLGLLAYVILEPLFAARSPLPVLAYVCFMMCVAALEAYSRCSYTYPRLLRDALASIVAGVGAVVAVALLCVLRTAARPWWKPRVVVPIIGMLLGNAISTTVLGLDRVLTELAERRAAVEFRLTLGASLAEAVRPAVRAAFHAGLTPCLNQLSVVGIVSMPGMLTGQILGGASPLGACAFQLTILYLIMAAACASLAASTSLAICSVAHLRAHRLRDGVLTRRPGKNGADLLILLARALARAACALWRLCRACRAGDAPAEAAGQKPGAEAEPPAGYLGAARRALARRTGKPSALAAPLLAPGAEAPAPGRGARLKGAAAVGAEAKADAKGQTKGQAEAKTRAEGMMESGQQHRLTLDAVQVGRPGSARGPSAPLLALPSRVELRSGDVLAITGPSGGGKSRLLRALGGLDELRAGSVVLAPSAPAEGCGAAGWELCSKGAQQWRMAVSYLPQNIPALAGTPAELLGDVAAFGARARRERAPGARRPGGARGAESLPALRARCAELAEAVGLSAAHLERGWEQLSGGERHRAALVLVLAMRPSVLLLDEPTASCDPATVALVEAAVLGSCASGAIALWVTHDAAQAARVGSVQLQLLAEGEEGSADLEAGADAPG